MRVSALLLLAALAGKATAEVYFKETFDKDWEKRWTKSTWKVKDNAAGEWKWTAGKWYGDAEADKGLQTSQDSKFYAISAEMKKGFTNDKKDLVVQFSVKHEQNIDCGGGYIKLIPGSSKSQMKDFGGDTPYSVMFGPDICGFGTRKTHVILPYKGKNHLIKKDIRAETDELTHVYTLRVMPNNTYQVLIDLQQVAEGSLEDDWDMLPPRKIKDPKATKPKDWDERAQIPDPKDKKPAGWDDIPATLPDPDAKKPEDWDDEDDGEWEPPTIPNPEYKGEWKPKMIDNPAYKGKWEAPDIDNPAYKADDKLHLIKDTKYVGFELWQVKAGSIFDNIIVTDSIEEAKKFAEDTWGKLKEAEKKMYDEAKKAEDDKKKADADKAAADDDDEYEDEDDDKKAGGDDKKKEKDAPSAKLDDEDEEDDEKDEL